MFVNLILTHQQIEACEVEGKTCVVIDTLRATSTIVTAMHFGCKGIIPALSMEEALQLHQKHHTYILGGEFEGEHLENFQLGNSPLDYTNGKIQGRGIIFTTTNGTRALLKVKKASHVCLCALLNAGAVAQWLATTNDEEICICCAGTRGDFSLEDYLTAGFLLHELLQFDKDFYYSNLAYAALTFYQSAIKDQNIALLEILKTSDNGKRLWEAGAFADLEHCSRTNIFPIVPLYQDGMIKRAGIFV